MAFFRFAALLIFTAAGFGQDSPAEAELRLRKELERNPRNSLAHFRLGELLSEQRNFQSAANEFREALNGDTHPQWIDTWAHINLGEIFDTTNQRDRAVRQYQLAAATSDNTGGAQAVVALHLRGIVPIGDMSLHKALLRTVTVPKPVGEIPGEYSQEARLAELEGTVTLTASVAADGSVAGLRIEKPLGLGLDEAAAAAVSRWQFEPGTTEDGPATMSTTVALNFVLPSKQSRWHLLRVVFGTPEASVRPRFVSTGYPGGNGIDARAFDSARLVSVMGRQALVTLSFDVDRVGRPVHFQIQRATEPVWGDEAISFVEKWKFLPGIKNGNPVSTPCTLDLVWSEREFTASSLAWASTAFESDFPQSEAR